MKFKRCQPAPHNTLNCKLREQCTAHHLSLLMPATPQRIIERVIRYATWFITGSSVSFLRTMLVFSLPPYWEFSISQIINNQLLMICKSVFPRNKGLLMMTEEEDCTILEVDWSGRDCMIQSKKVLQLGLFGPLQNFWSGYKYSLALFSSLFFILR